MTDQTLPTPQMTEAELRDYADRVRLWDRLQAAEEELAARRRNTDALEALLSLADRLADKVEALEAWQAGTAETFTTKMLRAEEASFKRPDAPAPHVLVGPHGIRVGDGDPTGPHVEVSAEPAGVSTDGYGDIPARAGVFVYATEDLIGTAVEAMHRPGVRQALGSIEIAGPEPVEAGVLAGITRIEEMAEEISVRLDRYLALKAAEEKPEPPPD